MFEFKKLKNVELEITSKCQASCPMCIRNIQGGPVNQYLPINEWAFDDFVKIFTEEIIDQIGEFVFSGSFGDPVMNDDLPKMCEYLKSKKPNVTIRIHTNGSMRKKQWWKDLINFLPKNHQVVFALDGASQDTHVLYRVGTNFDKIISNAKEFILSGGNAAWDFISFKHNEHEVEIVRNLSTELGFQRFSVKETRRFVTDKFKVIDKKGNFKHNLEPWSGSTTDPVNRIDVDSSFEQWSKDSNISCYALDGSSIYIDANFNVVPCCIIASFLYVNYDVDLYKKFNLYDETTSVNVTGQRVKDQLYELIENKFGGLKSLNARDVGLKNIVDSDQWQTGWKESWKNNGSMVCSLMCSKSSPFISIKEQTIKLVKNPT
jgi:MoaA/NifB/PqqE/SkfB family radical SAM enzyme